MDKTKLFHYQASAAVFSTHDLNTPEMRQARLRYAAAGG